MASKSKSFEIPEKAQAALQSIVEKFETGEVEGTFAKAFISRQPGSERPIDRWSILNRLIAWANGTEDARTFNAWKRAGRHVKKGAKAFYIVGPKKITVERENEDTGEVEKFQVIVGWKPVAEFRIEDTEGEPVEIPDYTPDEFPELIEVAESWGVEVRYAPGSSGFAYGSTDTQRRIELFTHDRQTFWHELAHVAHAKVLADRDEKMKMQQDAKQEAVAELAAATLANLYGCPNDRYSYNYIQGYSGGDVMSLVAEVLTDVEKVLDLILDAAEKTEQAAA